MTGQVCHAHKISKAGDNMAETKSVLSICPIASEKRANRFSLDPQRTGIRTVATYRFWMGHALPLVKTRFLSPRNSRGETAIWPANGRADVRSHRQSVPSP